MRSKMVIKAVDAHTGGHPVRLITTGFPTLVGKTQYEKQEYCRKNFDHVRTAVTWEPRGHRGMFVAIMTPPCTPGADFGMVYVDSAHYVQGCLHGTIGVATIMVETGMVPVQEPVTRIVLEPPSGLVTCDVRVQDGRAVEVTVENVPAYIAAEDLKLEIPGYGLIKADLSYGGLFFAIVDIQQFGIEMISRERVGEIIKLGIAVRRAVAEKMPRVQHPIHKNEIGFDPDDLVDQVMFYSPSPTPGVHSREMVMFGNGEFDRSPCGTGTSARVATEFLKGRLKMGEKLVHESITGAIFKGEPRSTTTLGNIKAVVPAITGMSYITGLNTFLVDPDDPLKWGFFINDK